LVPISRRGACREWRDDSSNLSSRTEWDFGAEYGPRVESPAVMTRANTKRPTHLRLQAGVLLVCLLLGPLGAAAASWLNPTPECCAGGMCKAHGHTPQQKKAEPSCDHEKNQGASDCAMKCGETSKEPAVLLPGLPEVILAPSFTILTPDKSRVEPRVARRFFLSQVLTPPDQPPRS
jgi:hypothetical protein